MVPPLQAPCCSLSSVFFSLPFFKILLSKQVNPRYPDFKRKDGSLSLWLGSAPQWVSSQLEGLKFDGGSEKPKAVKANKGESYSSHYFLVLKQKVKKKMKSVTKQVLPFSNIKCVV